MQYKCQPNCSPPRVSNMVIGVLFLGILERIEQLNGQNPGIVKTYLCTAVDHYASTYGDRGWGCGYR